MNIGDTLLQLISIFSASYGSILLSDYLKRRREKRSHADNMDLDFKRSSIVRPLLEDLKYELGAHKVLECAFSNGDTTLAGYHLKKVSVITESRPEQGEELVAPHFQLIPAKKFERTIGGLYESKTDAVYFNECEYSDDTAVLNQAFGFQSILMVAIRESETGKWIGYLFISWNKNYHPSDQEISKARLLASSIGSLQMKNIKLNDSPSRS